MVVFYLWVNFIATTFSIYTKYKLFFFYNTRSSFFFTNKAIFFTKKINKFNTILDI